MGISLKWFKDVFKSEKEKELDALKIENEIKFQKQCLEERPFLTPFIQVEQKPYVKLKFVNNVLTIVLNDGSVISRPSATEADFQKARQAKTEEELLKIAPSSEGQKEVKAKESEDEKIKNVIKGIEILKSVADFQEINGSIYLKGVKRSIPKLLVEKFAEVIGKAENIQSTEYQSLKKFWLKCCLNPNAQSAEDLYEFLTYHQFKIDKHGNFYAYRRVVSKGGKNKELVEFISNAYNKVKAVWKKKPSDYTVWKKSPFDSGEFLFSKGQPVLEGEEAATSYGNLQELYLNLPNMQENTYTSAHTGNEDYRVGKTESMPRNDGDDNNGISCSKGYHAASKEYDYSGFGDTPILVIINPMDVLAVPKNEVGKLRTCRWFFAMTLPEDEQFILDDEDFDVSELGDVFEEQCLINLEEHVKRGFSEEVKRHTFTLSNISSNEITDIVRDLEKMKETISKRIAVLD